jgi:8-oxo-dGTP pyrophosphatase MutT (NUDIX family)
MGEAIAQAAAICLRGAPHSLEVLLIASRGTGEWGLPKGHIEAGETSCVAARREAFEEAGVLGDPSPTVLGRFTYRKPGRAADYQVAVHLLHTQRVLGNFPERNQRRAAWVPLAQASTLVANRDLARLLDLACMAVDTQA